MHGLWHAAEHQRQSPRLEAARRRGQQHERAALAPDLEAEGCVGRSSTGRFDRRGRRFAGGMSVRRRRHVVEWAEHGDRRIERVSRVDRQQRRAVARCSDRRIAQDFGFGDVAAARPFAEHLLAGVQCLEHPCSMAGHADYDRHEVDVRIVNHRLHVASRRSAGACESRPDPASRSRQSGRHESFPMPSSVGCGSTNGRARSSECPCDVDGQQVPVPPARDDRNALSAPRPPIRHRAPCRDRPAASRPAPDSSRSRSRCAAPTPARRSR